MLVTNEYLHRIDFYLNEIDAYSPAGRNFNFMEKSTFLMTTSLIKRFFSHIRIIFLFYLHEYDYTMLVNGLRGSKT